MLRLPLFPFPCALGCVRWERKGKTGRECRAIAHTRVLSTT